MEFIVAGAPRSANANPRSRRRWRERVARVALGKRTGRCRCRSLDHHFYQGETTLDVDNIAKSLLDALKGVLFRDDKQVSELLIRKSRLSAGFSLTGASPYLLDAIERMTKAGSDFVYIRIDEAPDHSRIP